MKIRIFPKLEICNTYFQIWLISFKLYLLCQNASKGEYKVLNRAIIQKHLQKTVGKMPLSRFAKETGIPLSTLSRAYNGTDVLNLEHLEKIHRRFGTSVAWLLDLDGDALAGLPIRGFASCGVAQGWFTEENFSKTVLVPASFAGRGAFGVYAKGDSMIPAGIESGDLCIVDSSQAVEYGSAVMVRADWFYKGKNTPMATIKILESENESSYFLKGWFPAQDGLPATSFMDERPKTAITFIAPVVKVVKAGENGADTADSDSIPYDKNVLALCFDALKPVYMDLESEKFTSILDCLYRKVMISGKTDVDTVAEIVKLLIKK